jgi:hypothetical protein
MTDLAQSLASPTSLAHTAHAPLIIANELVLSGEGPFTIHVTLDVHDTPQFSLSDASPTFPKIRWNAGHLPLTGFMFVFKTPRILGMAPVTNAGFSSQSGTGVACCCCLVPARTTEYHFELVLTAAATDPRLHRIKRVDPIIVVTPPS